MNNKMLETPSGQIHLIKDEQLVSERSSQQLNLEVEDLKTLDSVVTSVMQKYIQRSLIGKKKYGTTLDRDDLTIVEWINHTQEELMDATLYLEKLKKTLIEKGLGPATTDT